jgi:ComF family protein
VRKVWSWLANLLFPQRCCLCGKVIEWQQTMCGKCRRDAPYVFPPICELCGRGEDKCSCRKRRRHFERCVMPFYYDGCGKSGVAQLKNVADRAVADGLAAEMAEVIRREYGGIAFDCVMPVAQFAKDERKKGHNPAALLARSLSRRMGIPYAAGLKKLFHTTPQKELRAVARSGNLLGAFSVEKPQKDKTVLLVDDTITTGSTLDECAKMLKIYGARRVYAVTVAGSVFKDEKGEDV